MELIEAATSDDPAAALARVAKKHEGKSYIEDLRSKAKVLLFLLEQGRLPQRGAREGGPPKG